MGLNGVFLVVDLPASVVNDIDVHPETRLLVAATFGRSQFRYQLDEVSSTSDKQLVTEGIQGIPKSCFSTTITLEMDDFSGQTTIRIMDIQGRTRLVREVIGNSGVLSVDIPDLESGIFTVSRLRTPRRSA